MSQPSVHNLEHIRHHSITRAKLCIGTCPYAATQILGFFFCLETCEASSSFDEFSCSLFDTARFRVCEIRTHAVIRACVRAFSHPIGCWLYFPTHVSFVQVLQLALSLCSKSKRSSSGAECSWFVDVGNLCLRCNK